MARGGKKRLLEAKATPSHWAIPWHFLDLFMAQQYATHNFEPESCAMKDTSGTTHKTWTSSKIDGSNVSVLTSWFRWLYCDVGECVCRVMGHQASILLSNGSGRKKLYYPAIQLLSLSTKRRWLGSMNHYPDSLFEQLIYYTNPGINILV